MLSQFEGLELPDQSLPICLTLCFFSCSLSPLLLETTDLSIGLTKGQILKLVVMPQALRIIIPPTTNQYLNLTKNSSLAAAIAYPDMVLVFAGTALMQTGRAVEIISITMGTYLLISLSISTLMNWYNKSVAIKEK